MMSETPQWFWDAIDTKPHQSCVDVSECDINYLTWSDKRDLPGLLLVHGHNAHAHWWDFIAPAFMQDYYPVAIDLSGMGDSDHRDVYSADTYAEEIIAVMDAAGMSSDSILVAHSFGGVMALRTVASYPGRFKGLVLLDSGVKHADDVSERDVERWAKPKVYPDFEIAKSRFRLQPPQTCENAFLVEHIARNSIEHIDEGWVWKFDEELNNRMKPVEELEKDLHTLKCKVALIYGELSNSFSKKSADHMKTLRPDLDVYELAGAQHHLFLDQPLDFIERLKVVLAGW